MSLTNENQDVKVPWWFNEESSRMLNGGYLLRGENLDGALERITSAAAKRLKRPDLKEKFKEIVWNGWMSLSSPIWANMGTQRGLPISCLSGDTLIEVKSGDVHLTMTIEELTKRWDEGVRNFQIKVFNTDTKTIEYSKINRVWETKKTKSLVYLSVGEAGTNNIRCTPDHLILMSNGEYKPAEEIKPLDKLQGESYKTVVEVKNVETEEEVSVFDIEVDHPSHNFYLPEAEVFVHNCFGVNVPDSLNLISDKLKEVTMQTKIGGGTSGYFGNIRERGAKIKDNGESSGPVPFMQLFDTTMGVVSQGGVRRGAFAAYLDIDHPDFEEFLQIRDIGNPIQNLFTGACIPDYWMQEMVDGDMEKRKLWAKVLESRQQKGMPYLFFTDNVNKNKPQVYKDNKMQITHSNLCVAPYTKILTSKGYQVIGELENQEVEVWNGEEWSKVTVKKTGSDQELVRVKLSSGQEIDCTPYHKFYVQVGIPGRGGKIVEKRAQELEEGDKLIKFDLPVIEGEETLEHAYDNGFFSGDGCEDKGRSKIYLYNKKRDLQKFFSSVDIWASQPNLNRDYGYGKDLKVKYFVPGANYTIESRLEWLAGLLDADGTSLKSKEGSCSLQIASVNQKFMRDLQLMLQTLGCHSKLALNREAGRFMLPKNDGTGELKEYDCKPVWRMVISCGALTKLTNMGLKCNRVKWNILKEPNRGALRFTQVENKPEKVEGLHDTYCFTEPKRHMGMFNGALIGQCSEIGLFDGPDESFVCCLSSLNLELYDEWKNTDTVKLAIYFLDAVMSEFIENSAGIPGLEAVNKFARRHRALGLGVMGYASYLQKNNIPFESMEAKTFNAKVFKEIESKARKASKELAKVYGEPELLKGYGLRNTTLMAIAP